MKGKIDLNDAVVSPFFVLASAISVGLISFSLFGIDFASAAFEFAANSGQTVAISYAQIIAVVALLVAYATNKPDFSGMGAIEMWAVVATVALVVAPPFVPIIQELLSNDLAGLLAIVVQAGGFYSLSYLG
jgi:hypothetical protein